MANYVNSDYILDDWREIVDGIFPDKKDKPREDIVVRSPSNFTHAKITALLGFTSMGKYTKNSICKKVGVAEYTVNNWRKDCPEFDRAYSSAVTEGRSAQIEMVEHSIFRKAKGFMYREEVMSKEGPVEVRKYLPPSDNACIFLLKNLKSDVYRDKIETDINSNGGPLKLNLMLDSVESISLNTENKDG